MYRQAISISVLSFVFAYGPQALAVLGGTAASAAKTQASLPGTARKASIRSANANLYTAQEITTDGITVREYAATSDGLIFAVTWRGVAEPDLGALLGDYYTEYKSEDAKGPATHASHRAVATSAIQVRRSGHMRDKRGLAFIKDRVPAGVDVGDLQ